MVHGVAERMGFDAVGICKPCDAVGGPLFALRRREGNQSPQNLKPC